MAAALDVGFLSAHLGVPEETLATVATTPTADLVRAVLDAVTNKGREFQELYSDKLNIQIEYENVVRSSESRCETYKATADTALKDVEDVRRQLQEEGTYTAPIPSSSLFRDELHTLPPRFSNPPH